jgi:hypothetical protein
LQEKEIQHLICCGALDDLGHSRAQLLAEAQQVQRAGSSRQLIFDFARQADVQPERAAQRFQWESHILGLPVSVHPLELVTLPEDQTPLRLLRQRKNQPVTITGTRLPGWTGGKGFYVDDGQTYERVILDPALEGSDPSRKSWLPLRLYGRWREDAWGGGWFQAESIDLLSKIM